MKYYVGCGETKTRLDAESPEQAVSMLLYDMIKAEVKTFGAITYCSERGFHEDMMTVNFIEDDVDIFLTVDIVEGLCDELSYEDSEGLPDLVGTLQESLFKFYDEAPEHIRNMLLGVETEENEVEEVDEVEEEEDDESWLPHLDDFLEED